MADTEEYFPRGGKKPTAGYFKQPGNFLGAADGHEKKKRKRKKTTEVDDDYLAGEIDREYQQSHKNCSVGLSVKTIKEGMLILGRVHHTDDTKVHVALPNRMRGVVMACHLCEAYNKLLEAYVNDQVESVRALRTIFRPGQYVATKVLEVDAKSVMLSMMPQHINANMQHEDLVKGTLLQAAVASVEDHGFVMDLGIQNARAFLPKDKTEEGIELEEGVLTWCTVTKSTITPGLCTVKLSARLETIQNAICRRAGKLSAFTPGTAVEFTVDKALDNGIEGHVFDNVTSYIQRNQTDIVKGKKPKLGQTIRARLLYHLPTKKMPSFTLKNIFESLIPNLEREQRYKAGDIVENAQVMKIARCVVVMKLGKKNVGLMYVKGITSEEEANDQQIIARSYPIGSEHRVRILNYNLSDYHYTVIDRGDVMEQKYFSFDDLSVGLTVEATITAVHDRRLIVKLDRLSGVVPITHVTDAGMYNDPKRPSKLPSKFKVGSKVQARVWCISPESHGLLLTMKPTLLADTDILDTFHEAAVGKRFNGVISCIKDYLIVTFFNNVFTFVPKVFISREPIDNLADNFHLGQIVSSTIINYYPDIKKYRGSLITPTFDPNDPRAKFEIQNSIGPSFRKRHNSDTPRDDASNMDAEIKSKRKRKNSDSQGENNEEKETIELNGTLSNNFGTQYTTLHSALAPHEATERSLTPGLEQTEPKSKKKRKNSESEQDNTEQKDTSEPNGAKTLNEDHGLAKTEDAKLLDLSGCTSRKKTKIRVTQIINALKKRVDKTDSIESKLVDIERRGLNKKSKRVHSYVQGILKSEQNRAMLLTELLKQAQDLLRTFPEESDVDKEKKKKKVKEQNGDVSHSDIEVKEKTQIVNERLMDIKVADVTTAIKMPSIKDFWSAEVVRKPEVKSYEELSSSEDEEEKEQPKKKRKKLSAAEKVAKAREEEERLRSVEMSALDGAPHSAPQFERALLAEPDCSRLWLTYAALHLQSTEIEKARGVCRRALKTINFREEDEKFNIWIAMVNMEYRFGSEESQQKTLEEALQMNEPYKVHSKLLDIFIDLNKTTELSSLVDKMIRKYKRIPETYIQCGRACYQLKMVDKARQVMQKAVAVLEKKEHITVLVQFALLERAHGDRDRAEALFEQILGVYPQRVDVCSAYVDMLFKSGDYEQIRQVMERMTSQKLPARKMKVLYKKWIEVEEKIGDEAQVDRIRGKAMEFIDNAKF